MGILEFLGGLAAILASIYYSIKIAQFVKQSYPYIRTALPWKKIGLKTVGGFRFFGIITGMGALVVSGMLIGGFLIWGSTTLYENLPENLKIPQLSTEISLLIWVPIIVVSLILLGYLLERIGLSLQSMGIMPKSFR